MAVRILRRSLLVALALATLGLGAGVESGSAAEERPPTGFVDLNYYYDTRDFNTLTINTLARISPRFSYYSLVNYFGAAGTVRNLDTTGYYTEQNLLWSPAPQVPCLVVAQAVLRSAESNDALRSGIGTQLADWPGLARLFKAIGLRYLFIVYPLQFDAVPGYQAQMEHAYRLQILPGILGDRLYFSGFIDHNVGASTGSVVTENQLGVRLVDAFFAVAEQRYNGNLTEGRSGFGLGAEYVIGF